MPLTITDNETATGNPIAINISAGGIAFGGNNVLLYPYADSTSIAVGRAALPAQNTNTLYNTAVGYEAADRTTSGSSNTALGSSALFSNTNGADNTAIGAQALYNATVGSNDGFVVNAGQYITTGNYNEAFGYGALEGISATPHNRQQ